MWFTEINSSLIPNVLLSLKLLPHLSVVSEESASSPEKRKVPQDKLNWVPEMVLVFIITNNYPIRAFLKWEERDGGPLNPQKGRLPPSFFDFF